MLAREPIIEAIVSRVAQPFSRMRQLIIALVFAAGLGGLWMCSADEPRSTRPAPDVAVTWNVTNHETEARVNSDGGAHTRVGVTQPERPGGSFEAEQPLVVLDAAGQPVPAVPVLGPLSGNSEEFAGAWAVLFAKAMTTDASGAWRPAGRGTAVPGTYAVFAAPHVCVLAPVDDRLQLVLPEIHELNIVPSGFGDGERWHCIAQPDYGQHPFAEVVLAGGVRVLLREILLEGSSQMQSVPLGPKNSEWNLDVSTGAVPASLARSRVAVPAAVQIARIWLEDRATLSVLAANRTRLSVDGVIRVAKEPNEPLTTVDLRDGMHVFDKNTFSQGGRYLIDVVLATGDVAGPIYYDPARDGSRIVAVVQPDAPRVLRIVCDTRAATRSVRVEHGGGFTSIPKLDGSSVGGAWFAQRASGSVDVFLAASRADGRVIWLVSDSGEVSIASLDTSATTIAAVAESVAEATIAPATFGVDEWPSKGLVALEVELSGVVSGKREIVPVAGVLTSNAKSAFGPFLRLTGARAQSFGLLSPRGGERIRVRL